MNSTRLSILHFVNLNFVGGVERYFTDLISCTATARAVRHSLIVQQPIHPFLRDRVRENVERFHHRKRIGGLKIPSRPRALRRAHLIRIARRHAPGVALLWNQFGDQVPLAAARDGGLVSVYWERGMGWLDSWTPEGCRAFLAECDHVIANSHAGRRILELRWGFTGPVTVHRNTLRTGISLADGPRVLPTDRPLRLGTCARFAPFKGVCLALRTLARLHKDGVEAELEIAGTGALQPRLAALADGLGIAGHVRWHGSVHDVQSFHDSCDVLLHPALREPCSNAVIEAMARGLPVVGVGVDGMTELVVDGLTGRLVPPTEDPTEAGVVGLETGPFPSLVYDPIEDRLQAPRAPRIAALAEAVVACTSDTATYRALSARAIEHVRAEYDARRGLERLLSELHAFQVQGPRGARRTAAPAPAGQLVR